MADLTDEQYSKEYQAAWEKLEQEAAQATPSRGPDGKFTKAEEKPVEPQAEPKAEDKPVEPPTEPEQPKEAVEAPEDKPDPLAEIKAELERAKKQAADNKAWATKVAQELAEAKRERERQEREAAKPQILTQAPELEAAIRYVAETPKPAQPDPQQEWMKIIEAAHPGIFAPDADPELVDALVAKRDASNGAWFADPLTAIREITEEKIAFAQRQAEQRFAAERQKAVAKSAMTVPGAGSGTPRVPADPAADEVKRIQSMSEAEFERERRRVLGY